MSIASANIFFLVAIFSFYLAYAEVLESALAEGREKQRSQIMTRI